MRSMFDEIEGIECLFLTNRRVEFTLRSRRTKRHDSLPDGSEDAWEETWPIKVQQAVARTWKLAAKSAG